jgi:HAD superfamily hydrolase (TIGR01509 family)
MRAILFDLDGTLLDIELQTFIPRYFSALARTAGDRYDGVDLVAGISASTGAMMTPHPGSTNREAFYTDFQRRTGIDLAEDWHFFERFYEDVFPTLKHDASPRKGARRALETARGLGLRVAIATNPIFPAIAVRHRLAWAGLSEEHVDLVTAYENMHACKPDPAYYRETADMLGVETAACLMVGDDRHLDLPAADVGMRTFYVGENPGAPADYCGDLDDLTELMPRLAAETW